jgi:PPM family protein phosphatase
MDASTVEPGGRRVAESPRRRVASGVATDPGLVRSRNEDRFWVDDDAGVFLVVDGVGGHVAGEKAAETAVDAIRASLDHPAADPERRVRQAIAAANNAIYALASENPQWRGMACVLTLALVEDDRLTIGHVGDSRLYLVWNGAIRKLTSDHSPVGEREDHAELSEQEAMLHPRRNEVFRDVGSVPREPDDDDFIEIRQCRFKPDAGILLCSDGLSDVLTAAEISRIVERYDGDPARVARELVQAANAAGGKDNTTAVFVAGPDFLGSASSAMTDARERHSTTRMRPPREAIRRYGPWTGRVAFLVYGLLAGLLMGAAAGIAGGRLFPW